MIELSRFFLQSTRPMMNGFASRGRSRLLLICCEAFLKGSKSGFIFEFGSVQTLRTQVFSSDKNGLFSKCLAFSISCHKIRLLRSQGSGTRARLLTSQLRQPLLAPSQP